MKMDSLLPRYIRDKWDVLRQHVVTRLFLETLWQESLRVQAAVLLGVIFLFAIGISFATTNNVRYSTGIWFFLCWNMLALGNKQLIVYQMLPVSSKMRERWYWLFRIGFPVVVLLLMPVVIIVFVYLITSFWDGSLSLYSIFNFIHFWSCFTLLIVMMNLVNMDLEKAIQNHSNKKKSSLHKWQKRLLSYRVGFFIYLPVCIWLRYSDLAILKLVFFVLCLYILRLSYQVIVTPSVIELNDFDDTTEGPTELQKSLVDNIPRGRSWLMVLIQGWWKELRDAVLSVVVVGLGAYVILFPEPILYYLHLEEWAAKIWQSTDMESRMTMLDFIILALFLIPGLCFNSIYPVRVWRMVPVHRFKYLLIWTGLFTLGYWTVVLVLSGLVWALYGAMEYYYIDLALLIFVLLICIRSHIDIGIKITTGLPCVTLFFLFTIEDVRNNYNFILAISIISTVLFSFLIIFEYLTLTRGREIYSRKSISNR